MLTTLRPDKKGRISLGEFAKGVSSFSVEQDEIGRIILDPQVEIPLREKWLYANKKALRSVLKGIEESSKGKLKKRKSYASFVDEEID